MENFSFLCRPLYCYGRALCHCLFVTVIGLWPRTFRGDGERKIMIRLINNIYQVVRITNSIWQTTP